MRMRKRCYRKIKMLSAIASDLVVVKWPNGDFKVTTSAIYVPDDEKILNDQEKLFPINLKTTDPTNGEQAIQISFLQFTKNEHGLLSLTGISNEQFTKMALRPGKNLAKLQFLERNCEGKAALEIEMNIYLWEKTEKIIISDIDGTITRSDKRGLVLPIFGINWAHKGVVELYSALAKNGYKLAYLSSRPIPLLNETAEYLRELQMPDGPIFLTPQGLKVTLSNLDSVLKPIPFKKSVLQNLMELFPPDTGAMIAGIGNQQTDIEVYRVLKFPRAFIVDEAGLVQIYEEGKKLGRITNYIEMIANLNDWFPQIPINCTLSCSEV